MGIFPWYSEGDPILWWSPDPRLILFPKEFRLSRRAARLNRSGQFRVTIDTRFDLVIGRCARIYRPGQRGTWITPEMEMAYKDLHRAGYAHSFETWRDNELVGGLYGVSLGACFFGESMFSDASDGSKIALAALVDLAKTWKFDFIDCQVHTGHLVRLGAREIPRIEFLRLLAKALEKNTRLGPWSPGASG
jgi:leucyl/phenylalanyl-tRNA--protein transferase